MPARVDRGSSRRAAERPPDASARAWYASPPDDVLAGLGASGSGLAADEVRRRLDRYGRNELRVERPTAAWVVALRQFQSPLIYILLASVVVTVLIREWIDASVIAAVLVLNATIGYVEERRAEHAVHSLMQLSVPRARVVRDGVEQMVDSRDLVPGDVVLLESGDRMPADARLLTAHALQVDESLLTGESLPVTKRVAATREGAPVADRTSMVHSGTVVSTGRARAVVVATGTNTELGEIADLIRTEQSATTPLQLAMNRFARLIGIWVGIACLVSFGIGISMGESPRQMFLVAVALAVAAVPEGLPIVLTIALALGVSRMARRNAIVRRLPAVEALGSASVIGSDKTGTLTENRMTVRRVWSAGRDADWRSPPALVLPPRAPDPLAVDPTVLTLVVCALANEATFTGDGPAHGDPTEVALLRAAAAAGLAPDVLRTDLPVVAELPFEPDLRYSAALATWTDHEIMVVKGAPERVLAMCDRVAGEDGLQELDPETVHDVARSMAAQGLRVLAMAIDARPRDGGPSPDLEDPHSLVLVGLVGMLDPARQGVGSAIRSCRDAGVRVIMITGDHALTGAAIARQIGLAREPAVLSGAELAELDDAQLRVAVGTTDVFARVAPEQKLRIVRALQANSEVVAVTGDGVNDAPALKAAAIGVAMGRTGTDVAREAADIVLADDDFVTIVAAIEEGRVTFDNVRKATAFLVTTAVATIVAILVAVGISWPLLMLPAQLLWLNLVTNGLQDVALAFERGEPGTMRRPPRRPGAGILDSVLWIRTVLVGVTMAVGALALFRWELDSTGSPALARTVALTTIVVAMAFHAGNSRSRDRSVFAVSPRANPFLTIATAATLALHAAALYVPFTQYVLRVEPLSPQAWLRIVAVASSVLVVSEIDKAVRRWLSGRGPAG